MDADGLTEALARVRSVTRTDMPLDMRAVFADDPGRAGRFTAALDDLTIDCSKCAITDSILEALIDLARACRLESRRDAMFAGERINVTENRAALHVALRAPRSFVDPPYGSEIARAVHEVLDRATDFASRVRNGVAKGATGKRFVDIVNIGIGGSDLGPAMATAALAPYHDGPRAHFVSNVDGAEIISTLDRLDPESSLFIVASKTFTTTETMMNAGTARSWLREKLGDGAVRHHFAAVSTTHDRVREFGIDPQRVFGFWDWVGGRYSLWSAIGLPLMIAVGPANFRSFLDGGHALDRHFADAPLRSNLPVLLGLIGYWHRAILGYPSRAVVPYDRRLARFPAYLQQLDMESNGKGVGLDGSGLAGPSGPVVWGEPGTNGQHAFFQLLHQGTDIVPVEFLAAASGHEPGLDHHHRLLLANCLAQSEALMLGRGTREAEQRLIAAGHSPKDAARLAPHRRFPGNRPSITILYRKLDPFGLGRLIALYEHRVFVEAVLYGINPFDQWGVELGKELATALVPLIDGDASVEDHDASTASLVARIRALRTGR